MPTYAELGKELQWSAEHEAPAHAALNERLRAHYGHSRSQTGSKGDNNHLYGRHRSRNWTQTSHWCTDRMYGATDRRDTTGDGDWLRATDLGITGTEHHAASRRLNVAVRAGRLPCLAEWFGSFDGRTVVGWYEGGPSSADDSHLSHLHLGLWTAFCNDDAQLQLLGDVITGVETKGTTMPPPAGNEPTGYDWDLMRWRVDAILFDSPVIRGGTEKGTPVTSVVAKLADRAAAQALPGQVGAAAQAGAQAGVAAGADALAAAVIARLPEGALTKADVEAAVRAAFAGGLAT
jgi:hypothetical protein